MTVYGERHPDVKLWQLISQERLDEFIRSQNRRIRPKTRPRMQRKES